MQPKMEQPKQYTPEEMAQLEKSRTASDKALGDRGAEYKFNEKGEKENLLVSDYQQEKISEEKIEEEVKVLAKKALGILKDYGIVDFFVKNGNYVAGARSIDSNEFDNAEKKVGALGVKLAIYNRPPTFAYQSPIVNGLEIESSDGVKKSVPLVRFAYYYFN